MGGHGSHPLGWTVLALVVVAYAHAILELAAAGLALAIAARIMTGAPSRPLVARVMCRQDRRARRGSDAIATQRSIFEAPALPRRISASEERRCAVRTVIAPPGRGVKRELGHLDARLTICGASAPEPPVSGYGT